MFQLLGRKFSKGCKQKENFPRQENKQIQKEVLPHYSVWICTRVLKYIQWRVLKYIQWPRMTKCAIFISCRRLTPTRNRWTMVNIGPSSPKNISKNMLPKGAYFLVDLAGTAWPSWHLAKFLPFRPCMLRLSAPTGSAARCNVESGFFVASLRAILGFCQRTPNGWSLFLELKHVQTKKERGHILSAKTVSRWSYQEVSAKLWNLQCNHNALVIGPSHR